MTRPERRPRPVTVISAHTDVYEGVIGGHAVLFAPQDRRLHVLNETACAVWRALDVGRTLSGLVTTIAEDYGVQPSEIVDDVEALVTTLIDAGLARVGSAAPAVTAVSDVDEIVDPYLAASLGHADVFLGPFVALGTPITVGVDDTFLRLELERILRPLGDLADASMLGAGRTDHQHLSVSTSDGAWIVRRNGRHVATVSSRGRAIRTVVAECNSAPLVHIDDAVVLHASGADLGRGLVVFPGVSNAGKSTLVTQLLLRGHRYLTDEAVAVDLTSLGGRPYPKSITIEPGAQALFEDFARRDGRSVGSSTWDVDPRSLSSAPVSHGGPIHAVVFPEYDQHAPDLLRPLDPIEALRHLISNTFDFGTLGQAAFDALVRMATALPCYSLRHQGGADHLDQLELMFGREAEAVSL